MGGIVIKGCEVFRQGGFVSADVEILDGIVTRIQPGIVPGEGVSVCNFDNCLVVPGLVDVHVHLREPGFSYKETIASGTGAAARSGYAAVCAMPNLSPVPEDAATLAQELAEEIVEAALRRSGEWAGLDAAETGNAPDGAYRYALYEAHGAARVPYAYGILGQQRLDGEWKTVAMIAPFSNDSAATAHLARLCTGQQLEPIHILDVIHDFMNTEARTL